MFELVKSSDPQTKLAVLDIDDLDERDDIEFVVGVGVATSAQDMAERSVPEGYADSGYQGFDRDALLIDVVREESRLDEAKVLEFVLPKVRKTGATFIPLYRYLRDAGIDTEAALLGSEYESAISVYNRLKGKSYKYGSTYNPAYHNNWSDKSAEEIVTDAGLDKATIFLAYKARDEVDLEWLRKFLGDNMNRDFSDPYSTAFKKLICLYDKWVYGFGHAENEDIIAELIG